MFSSVFSVASIVVTIDVYNVHLLSASKRTVLTNFRFLNLSFSKSLRVKGFQKLAGIWSVITNSVMGLVSRLTAQILEN